MNNSAELEQIWSILGRKLDVRCKLLFNTLSTWIPSQSYGNGDNDWWYCCRSSFSLLYCNHNKCMWLHGSLCLDSFSNTVCQLKLKYVSLMLFGAKKNNWIRKTRKANQDAWIIYVGLLLTGGRALSCLEAAMQFAFLKPNEEKCFQIQ